MKDIRLVEIELFSYCNRKCNWCPNREIDRTFVQWIDHSIFTNLINEINEYTGAITFSRFNEPLSQNIVKHLKYIKERVNCPLVTNTNGDYLNNISWLLDEITIMNYDKKPMEQCMQELNDIGVSIDEVTEDYIYGHRHWQKICYVVNWKQRTITDRGGFMKEYNGEIRTTPCMEPTYFVGINYDGTVSPCCNIRNDIEEHKPYILGDLNNNSSLKEILVSPKAVSFRDKCAKGEFEEGSPCYRCANSGGRYTRGNGGIKYE